MTQRASRYSAVSLPLDALQTMSRGELIHTSNVLHAGFVLARQQAGRATLRETIANEETQEARKELACVQVDLQQMVHTLQRELANCERQSRLHAEEKIRLQTLLHAADDELVSQTSLRTLISATSSPYASSSSSSSLSATAQQLSTPAITAADPAVPVDDTVSVSRHELQSLRQVLTCSKFRVADLEDQLQAARADVIKLERVLRSSRGNNCSGSKDLDAVEVRFRIEYLEKRNAEREKEMAELRETLIRTEVQLRTSQHELADALEKLERSIEDDIATGGLAGHSSLLSSSSLGTNAPNQRRKRSSREGSSRIGGGGSGGGGTAVTLSYALPADTGDDPFGVPLSVSVASQTDKLVLQNVELLFQLQRDLLDLQSRREALEAQAQRDAQENLRLGQRVEALEYELQQRSELIRSMAAGSTTVAATTNGAEPSGSASGIGVQPRTKGSTVLYTTTGAALLRRSECGQERDDAAAAEKVIVQLRFAVAESERRIAELLSANEKLERRVAELGTTLAKNDETAAHLTAELSKSLELVARLQQEKKQLESLVMGEGHEGGLSDFLSKENSLNLAEDRIYRLEKELETASGLEHRLAALEVELAQAHTDLTNQQNLVVRMAADRDAAMAEVQQMAGAHGQAMRRHTASCKRFLDAAMRWVDARCDGVGRCYEGHCEELVEATVLASAVHRGVGVALGATSSTYSSYRRQQDDELESEKGYRSVSSFASLEATKQRVEAEIASRMGLGSRSSSLATATAATASATTSPPSSFHFGSPQQEVPQRSAPPRPQPREHQQNTLELQPRVTLDALAAGVEEQPLVRHLSVGEEETNRILEASTTPWPRGTWNAVSDLAAPSIPFRIRSTATTTTSTAGLTTLRDLNSPPQQAEGTATVPDESESTTPAVTPASRRSSSPPHPTTVAGRGMLGAVLVEEFGALVIDAIVYDSPAYVSGLKAGDCVCAVDGHVVNTLEEFATQIHGKTAFSLAVMPGARASLASSPSKDQLLLSEGIETVEVLL